MSKLRIHELAKKLQIPNQDLIEKLISKGFFIKTHSNSVDELAARKALGIFTIEKNNQKPKTILRRKSKKNQKNNIIFNKKTEIKNLNHNIKPLKIKPLSSSAQKDLKHQSEKTKIAKNIIRIIDPKALKQRLISEEKINPQQKRKTQNIKNTNDRNFKQKNALKEIKNKNLNKNTLINDSKKQQNIKTKQYVKKKSNKYINKIQKETNNSGFDLWENNNKKKKNKENEKNIIKNKIPSTIKIISLNGAISINDLAHKMSIKASYVVAYLIKMGMMVTANKIIDFDTATLVAQEFKYEIKNTTFKEKDILKIQKDNPKNVKTRIPIVTIMGHVNHGKTTLLDAIKKSNIAKHEAGKITQHISTYPIKSKFGNITFIDTPGHESFLLMRSRIIKITDIIVLVIASNDGIMPQTKEIIKYAQEGNIPIIVAINKIDLKNIKLEKIIEDLSKHNLIPEEWGGNTQIHKISAINNSGLSELLEGIILQAEIMELTADNDKNAEGSIIEAKLDKGKGPIATVLIKSGKLLKGNYVVAGQHYGKVRAIYNNQNNSITNAYPSIPINILGLSGVPKAGDSFNVVNNEKEAKKIVNFRNHKNKENITPKNKITLEKFLKSTFIQDKKHTIKIIIKADVFGSIDAICHAINSLKSKEVGIEIIYSGVGNVTENDINLAIASKAIVIAFNSKTDNKIKNLANLKKIKIQNHNIIYDITKNIQKIIKSLITPIFKEKLIGKAEVKKMGIF